MKIRGSRIFKSIYYEVTLRRIWGWKKLKMKGTSIDCVFYMPLSSIGAFHMGCH